MQGWRRVGNELGAGSAAGARLAMDAAALTAPALWLAAAAVLGAPAAQRALVGLFTTPGDVALLAESRPCCCSTACRPCCRASCRRAKQPVHPHEGPVCSTARPGAGGGAAAAAGHRVEGTPQPATS